MSIAKLRWQCRRGMLELDLLLKAFLEKKYEHLSLLEQETFVRLLESQDDELYAWLVKKEEVPGDVNLAALINRVRRCV